MKKSKGLILIIFLVTFATNVSADPEKSSNNPQKLDLVTTQQLELSQQFWLGREQPDDRERINKILEQLNLSAQQKRQVTAIRKRFKTERDNLDRQIKDRRQEMRSLLTTNTSRDRLKQDYQETRSLLERLGENRFEMMMQIRKILTPQQRVQLIDSIY